MREHVLILPLLVQLERRVAYLDCQTSVLLRIQQLEGKRTTMDDSILSTQRCETSCQLG